MSTAANPRAPKPDPSNAPQESTGAITSDSLAAESIDAGGAFSKNDNADVMGVKGSNSTLNTTDTSGATALHSARDGATREAQVVKALGSDERGTTGVKYPDAAGNPEFSGSHSSQGYAGGSQHAGTSTGTGTGTTTTDTSRTGGYGGASGDSFADGGAGITGDSSLNEPDSNISSKPISSSTGAPISSSDAKSSSGVKSSSASGSTSTSASSGTPNTAPNYAATVSGAIHGEGQFKPKGDNLDEGDIPNTKTFTGNVGGDKDPGRLAEQGFAKINANTAGVPGGKQGTTDGGQFDALDTERA